MLVARTQVLIDGYQFIRPTGTGTSYVNTLAATLKACGCSVSVLFGQPLKADPRMSPGAATAAVFTREVAQSKRLDALIENAAWCLASRLAARFVPKPSWLIAPISTCAPLSRQCPSATPSSMPIGFTPGLTGYSI